MSVFTDKWIDEHKDELIERLSQCIRIKSVRDDATAREGAPFGTGAAECLESTLAAANDMGFDTKNLDGYCGTVDFGSGKEMLGILAHLDVVPEGEGWLYPPYAAEIHDGKLFGRGAMDDKGPAFAALFGMAAVKASGVKTRRRVRLILGCDEECGMGCLHHYNEVEEAPTLSFSPDASYPIINSEKMIYGSSYAKSYPSRIRISAGTVSNAVPGKALVFIPVSAQQVKCAISKLNNADFEYDIAQCDGGVSVTVNGLAAHASMPELGKNAFLGVLELLNALPLEGEDASTVAALADVLKFDNHGESIGIDSSDASGRLTTNVGVIDWDETGIKRMTMDIRAPISASGEVITAKLREAFGKAGMHETHSGYSNGYYMPSDCELVSKLLGVYNTRFNTDAKPIAMGGGTYARHLSNAVAFGTEREDEPACIHMANECIRIDHLIEDAKIMADAIIALAAEE